MNFDTKFTDHVGFSGHSQYTELNSLLIRWRIFIAILWMSTQQWPKKMKWAERSVSLKCILFVTVFEIFHPKSLRKKKKTDIKHVIREIIKLEILSIFFYCLSYDIYAAHCLQIFDIYKHVKFKTKIPTIYYLLYTTRN